MSDYYNSVAQRRQLLINARRQELISQLAYHEANDDTDAGTVIAQELANLEAEETNFQQLQRRYQRQGNSPAQAPLTDNEFMALSPERMAQHPEAIDRIFSKSKYYSPDQWSDPKVQGLVRAGMEEVQRRRRYETGDRS